MTESEAEPRPEPALIARLVENHREFQRFLQSKLGDKALAEDILQEAFVKGLAKADSLRDDDSARAWFYRMLRNAVIDHARRRASASRRLEAFAHELEQHSAEPETVAQLCECVTRIASTLKPEYRDAVQRIEVEGMSVKDFAASVGISSGNAAVRVFRAREALRNQVARSCGTCAEHGCLDCSCGQPKRE